MPGRSKEFYPGGEGRAALSQVVEPLGLFAKMYGPGQGVPRARGAAVVVSKQRLPDYR
jgi:hypothetical protein